MSGPPAALVKRGLVDVVQPDTGRCGGITQLRKIGALAEAHFVQVAPHAGSLGPVAEVAALHVMATLPNALMLERFATDWEGRSRVVTASPELRDGGLVVLNAPGLGIDLNLDEIAKHPAATNVSVPNTASYAPDTEGRVRLHADAPLPHDRVRPRGVVSKPQPRVVPGTRCEVGEGAIWCARRSTLWFVDIRGRAVCALEADGVTCRWPLPDEPGCLALSETDELFVAMSDAVHAFDPATGVLRMVAPLPDSDPAFRANDGAVSRGGRFWFGTVARGDCSHADGVLYSWRPGEAVCRLNGFHVVNGLAFSPDDRTLYVSDSYPDVQTIWSFDHDPETGDITNRRTFRDMSDTVGRPDGACVDAEGCYWIAGVGGGELLRLDASGATRTRIAVPVERPSKPCFGGATLRTLFAMSIANEDERSGHVVWVSVDCEGCREPIYRA